MSGLRLVDADERPPDRDAGAGVPHPTWCDPTACCIEFTDRGICGTHAGAADALSPDATDEIGVRRIQHVDDEVPGPVLVEVSFGAGFVQLSGDEAELLSLMLRRRAEGAR